MIILHSVLSAERKLNNGGMKMSEFDIEIETKKRLAENGDATAQF